MPISPGYAAPTLAIFADSFNFVCATDVQPISIAYTLSLWPVLEDEGQQSAFHSTTELPSEVVLYGDNRPAPVIHQCINER
jgi:hypothetical protein